MRAVAIPLLIALCAAVAHSQSASGSGATVEPGSASAGSGSGLILPPPPTVGGGLIDLGDAPVEVVVPMLIHESIYLKVTGGNWSLMDVNETFANISQALQLPFKGMPYATNDSIGIGLIVNPGNASAAVLTDADLVRPSMLPARDVEAMLSEANANVLMFNLWTRLDQFRVHVDLPFNTSALQLLLPAVYEACADCALSVSASFPNAPRAFFNHSAAFAFHDHLAMLQAAGANGTVNLLELLVNGTIVLAGLSSNENSVLGIQLDVPSFVPTVNSSMLGVEDGLTAWLVQSLVTHVVVGALNEQWDAIGVSIPMFGNAKVTALELAVADGAAHVGADLAVPAAAA